MSTSVHPDCHHRATLPNGLPIACVSSLDLNFLYKEIFEQRIYLQHGIELQPGNVVLDCGANIGLFSLFAAGIVGPTVLYSLLRCFQDSIDRPGNP
jgi:hypothetical protein